MEQKKQTDVRAELEKFKGKEILIDIIGKDFAPKGILKEVNSDFVLLNDQRIMLSAIAGFRPARSF